MHSVSYWSDVTVVKRLESNISSIPFHDENTFRSDDDQFLLSNKSNVNMEIVSCDLTENNHSKFDTKEPSWS